MGSAEVLTRETLEERGAKTLEGSAGPVPRTWWRWWQWVLAYPSLAAVILGAVPTLSQVWQSYRLHVPVKAVPLALEQYELWQKNAECSRKEPPQLVKTDTNAEVEVTLCPASGDMLVKVQRPDTPRPSYRWIGFSTFNESQWPMELGRYFVPAVEKAFAEEMEPRASTFMLAQYGSTVLCQFLDGKGLIVRILQAPGGGCTRESVNPYTGQVVNSTFWPSCSCS